MSKKPPLFNRDEWEAVAVGAVLAMLLFGMLGLFE